MSIQTRRPSSHRLPSSARPIFTILLTLVLLSAFACSGSDPVAEVRGLQAKGQFGESLGPLRELLETHSDDAEVHYLYGLALTAAGKPTLAQWSFRKALEDDEWRKSAAMQLAAGALRTGNHEAAIEASTQVLEIEPENVDALLIRTHALVNTRRNYEGSLADADRVLELDPENSTALSLRGVSLLGLERVEEAGVVVEELERRFREENLGLDDTARYCATRATFAKEGGDIEEATRLFDECLETFPTRPIVVEGAIEVFDQQGLYDRSLEVLKTALEEAPFSAYRNPLASRLRSMGDIEGAEQTLKEGTELEAPAAVLASWVHLSNHYFDLEEMEKGLAAMEGALAHGGDQEPQLQFAYAEALVLAHRYEEAEVAAKALSLPAYREMLLGRIELARGEPAQALLHFTEGLRLWPDTAPGRYYTAVAAEQTGDFDRAIAEYRYSIRADPAATDARLRLARLHAAEGAAALALTVARQGIGRYGSDIEAQLFAVKIAAETGLVSEMRSYLSKMESDPKTRGASVAAAADGMRTRQGSSAAVRFLIGQRGLDLMHPINASALRVLTLCAATSGAEGALTSVVTALERNPESAELHEIHGLALSQMAAPAEELRAAYTRALELDPKLVLAMIGLGNVARAGGDLEQALLHYREAAKADPDDPSPIRESLNVLTMLEREQESEAELEKLLIRDPYDSTAAIRLGGLLIDREDQADRSRELAERAVRFRGGAEAYDLLARVHTRDGDTESAADASARAAEIRALDESRDSAAAETAAIPQS